MSENGWTASSSARVDATTGRFSLSALFRRRTAVCDKARVRVRNTVTEPSQIQIQLPISSFLTFHGSRLLPPPMSSIPRVVTAMKRVYTARPVHRRNKGYTCCVLHSRTCSLETNCSASRSSTRVCSAGTHLTDVTSVHVHSVAPHSTSVCLLESCCSRIRLLIQPAVVQPVPRHLKHLRTTCQL